VKDDVDAADFITNTGPRLPADRIKQRLIKGLVTSVIANALIWTIVAQVVRSRISVPLPPATFKRIFIAPPPKPPKRVHHVQPPKRQPKLKQQQQTRRAVPPKAASAPVHRQAAPPTHSRILTAKGPTEYPAPSEQSGNAPLGLPISQGPANPNPSPPSAPQQAVQSPTPQPAAPVKPAPPPAQPVPPPGPTQDAQPENQIYPQIPDELKSQDYKSFVRVKVVISADGSFTANLVTSSGSLDIDQRVLDALKKWKWKPALSDGDPVDSTQRFRFNFEVQ
jgi:protein TonB